MKSVYVDVLLMS